MECERVACTRWRVVVRQHRQARWVVVRREKLAPNCSTLKQSCLTASVVCEIEIEACEAPTRVSDA